MTEEISDEEWEKLSEIVRKEIYWKTRVEDEEIEVGGVVWSQKLDEYIWAFNFTTKGKSRWLILKDFDPKVGGHAIFVKRNISLQELKRILPKIIEEAEKLEYVAEESAGD